MNILRSVKIDGFWGDKKIAVNFYKDVNFFIGVNGSGKTTVINLIAAVLTADFVTLNKIDFSKVAINLAEVGGRKKPVIEVEKVQVELSPYPQIVYRIKEMATSKYAEYSLDEFEEESMLRRGMVPRNYRVHMKRTNRGILARLQSMTNVSWLSIHRASAPEQFSEANYESSVDKKLDELNTSLVKYFSSLSSRVSEEIADFQRNIIVSLLTEQTESAVFSSVQKLDLESEKKALIEIFRKLNISKSSHYRLDKHFRDVSGALKKVDSAEPLQLSEVMLLVGSYRSHKVVQDWNRLLKRQAAILEPKNTFINILNELFQRKKIYANERNELEIETQSGKIFSIRGLSSGEKQLIIILGEALLQQSSPWIYIADEPELSLHVSWQESLISNLVKINPSAQILCATHSPDVVSNFSKNVFDMEAEVHDI